MIPFPLLTDFEVIRPEFETLQEKAFEWMIAAHAKAEMINDATTEEAVFQAAITEKLHKVGCKKEDIHKRGHAISDFLHTNWNEMLLYKLEDSPMGAPIQKRSELYEKIVDKVFETYYEKASPPDDLIHVTCTGYASPSAGQKLVAKKGWETTVTHAYHMGCYAALPAIRIGSGFAKSGNKVDIVHTEICTLHKNPLDHAFDQLVGQSLFADGFIKYSIVTTPPNTPHFKVLAILEEIIPNSETAMTWHLHDFGFKLSLSREIPVLIARNIKGYMERLCKKVKVDLDEVLRGAHFAIHPGGPRILDQVQKILNLKDDQIKCSREILYEYGNMSSGTLPHIWERMQREKKLPNGGFVVGLAFGPGLTIAGIILESR